MTTHDDAAAHGALMHTKAWSTKPDLVPSIYRLAGVAQALSRVDGKVKPGPHSLERAIVVYATSKVTKKTRWSLEPDTHKDSTGKGDLSVVVRLG